MVTSRKSPLTLWLPGMQIKLSVGQNSTFLSENNRFRLSLLVNSNFSSQAEMGGFWSTRDQG